MYHALVASALLHVPCHILPESWRADLSADMLTSQSDHLSFWLQCVPYEWVCDLHSPLPVLGPTLPQPQNTVKTAVQVTVTAELEAGPSLGPDPEPGPVHFPSCDLYSALHAATHQLVSWPVLTCVAGCLSTAAASAQSGFAVGPKKGARRSITSRDPAATTCVPTWYSPVDRPPAAAVQRHAVHSTARECTRPSQRDMGEKILRETSCP